MNAVSKSRLLSGLNVGAWVEEAACRDMPSRAFFPESGENRLAQEAKKVCARCPVEDRCREAGMVEQYGVWGGLTETDREKVRKARTKVCA